MALTLVHHPDWKKDALALRDRLDALIDKEIATSNPATEPLSAYCNWGTVCRLPVGHAGPHEYPAKERP